MNAIETIKRRLQNTRVGIAGCGGLGSNCAAALARAGVGKLVIVDFDVVDESNISRQYYFLDQIGKKKVEALKENIGRMAPQVEIVCHDLKLTPEKAVTIFADCQVVVEAFDRAEMKQMLIETVLEHFPDKWIVAASGLAGYGNNNRLHTRQNGRLLICGDETAEVSENLPPLAPRVAAVAGLQANQVLEILLDHPLEK